MDVTKRNFRAAFALVRKFLPGATFVSFDLEFTGLGESRPSQLDTPQSRYTDARSDVDDYVPIQFGLAIFRRLEIGWQVVPFNFNLAPGAVYHPRTARYPLIDRKFTLQASTVAFLSQHGFDFDKCLRLGVSWLPKNMEVNLRKHVEADLRKWRKEHPKQNKVSDDEKKLLQTLQEKVSEFVKEAELNPESPAKQVTILSFASSPTKRSAAFRYIRKFNARIVGKPIWTSEGVRLRLQLYKTEEEASSRREEALLEDVDDIVTQAVGFRYIVDLMLEARVPLIVHNGLMDITKLYGTFVGPPPNSLPEFKALFREAFPAVYDTRLLIEELAARDTEIQQAVMGKRFDLSEVVQSLREIAKTRGLEIISKTFVPTSRIIDRGSLAQAIVESDEGFFIKDEEPWDEQNDRHGFGRYTHSEFEHEAGFDAVQTGLLYALTQSFASKASEGEKGVDHLEGKIFLSSCGGYRWVDFASAEEDEINSWYGKDALVISRDLKGQKRLEIKEVVGAIFKENEKEPPKHQVTFAGPDAFIVLLEGANPSLTSETFAQFQTRAEQIGVKLYRYSLESLTTGGLIKNKKRKFSDRT